MMEMNIITGICAKVTVKATIITNDGRRFIGMNWCRKPRAVCPRKPGEDYTKCITICDQIGHAEFVACHIAGELARGATLYIEGHTHACDSCTDCMTWFGVEKLIIGSPPQ